MLLRNILSSKGTRQTNLKHKGTIPENAKLEHILYLGQDFREGEVTLHGEWGCLAYLEGLGEQVGFEFGLDR